MYSSQMQEHEDIILAIKSFAAHHIPSLKPAFGTETSHMEGEFLSDPPPSYNQPQNPLQASDLSQHSDDNTLLNS